MNKNYSKKILLVENFGSDFYKSRLPLALFLKKNGYEVFALIPDDGYIDLVKNSGISVLHYPMSRGNKGFLQVIRLVFLCRKMIKEHGFDLVHSFRFQPNFICSIATVWLRCRLVLHITGLGIAYSNRTFKYILLRWLSQLILFFKFLCADLLILQNKDDIASLWFTTFNRNKIRLILGSGVDLSLYKRNDFQREEWRASLGIATGDIVFICITRLIWEKGIKELTEGFLRACTALPQIKLFIVGWSDKDNPRHVSQTFINSFLQSKNIFFLGKRNDINKLLTSSDAFIYPSYYREGIPRAILEAMAMSIPIITTDMPGCRLTVKEGFNGYLIETKSVTAIENVVKMMTEKRNEFNLMGKNSRMMAEKYFENTIVFKEILEAYQSIL